MLPLKTKEIINNLKDLKRLINYIYPRKCCKKIIILKYNSTRTINQSMKYHNIGLLLVVIFLAIIQRLIQSVEL